MVKNSTIRDLIRKVEHLTRRIEQSEKEIKLPRGENEVLRDETPTIKYKHMKMPF